MTTQTAYLFENKYDAEFKASHLVKKTDVEKPKAEEGQLVVRVHAIGLNPFDYIVGSFGFLQFPFTPGYDVAGVVEEVGSGVTNFKIGDRVSYHAKMSQRWGAFAEYSVNEAISTIHIPDSVSFVDAAAIPCAGWTAWIALHDKARIRKGETVVITAGAGGVGGFAIQLAKQAGCEVITTCSAKNFEFVKKLGADHCIDYNKDDIKAKVMEITKNRGVDFWVDMISAESADLGVHCLTFGGGLIAIQSYPTIPIGNLFTRQVSFNNVCVGGAHNYDDRAKKHLAHIGTEMINLVQQKKLHVEISEVVSFDQIPEALERIKARHVVGKIVAKGKI